MILGVLEGFYSIFGEVLYSFSKGTFQKRWLSSPRKITLENHTHRVARNAMAQHGTQAFVHVVVAVALLLLEGHEGHEVMPRYFATESIGIRGLEIESSSTFSTFINPPFGRDLSQALANGSAGWIYVAEAGNLLRISRARAFHVPKKQQKPTTMQGKVWCCACIHK